jgi:peptidoglycan/LPS O-acetylase OafA/YrhL
LGVKPSSGRITELDGWRAVSVLCVIFGHFCSSHFPQTIAHHPRPAQVLLDTGSLGVKVFFVISGFVICRLLIMEEQRFGAVSLKGFYIRRAFRILPPFYLYLAAIAILSSLALISNSWLALRDSMLFLYDLRLGVETWFVGHTWSLAVEEQFYLVFPACWVLLGKLGRKRVFPSAFLLIVIWNIAASIADWDRLTWPSTRAGFACICCGVVLATFEDRARKIAASTFAPVIAILAAILIWRPVPHLGWGAAVYESVFVPPAIGLVLMFSLERGHVLRMFLNWKPIQAIGLTSYGIYLWQQLFSAPPRYYMGLGIRIFYMLPLLLVIIPCSYLLVEKPAMRLGRRLSERFRRTPAPERVTV